MFILIYIPIPVNVDKMHYLNIVGYSRDERRGFCCFFAKLTERLITHSEMKNVEVFLVHTYKRQRVFNEILFLPINRRVAAGNNIMNEGTITNTAG